MRIGIGLPFCGGTVSNLSVCYDKELTIEYIEKSWEALSLQYVPSTTPMLLTISDNVDTSRVLSNPPNSAAHQLDTLLVRGLSHRMFSILTVELLGNGNSEIALWLNTVSEEFGEETTDLLHDFAVGDVIYIDGIEQDGLNGCWRVERLGQTSIYFTVVGEDYEDEEGYFLIKRAPVGGGAWTRNANKEFVSASSTLDGGFKISDIDKNSSTLSLTNFPNKAVLLRRYHKRSSGHYLGEDKDSSKVHWTIIGDDLRFVLVVAYKQNPRSHCRIILFGDVTDINDDTLKTMLIGYVNNQLGDVGFNRIHEYFDPIFSDKGMLQLSPKYRQPSGMGWIYSNAIGEIDYLLGTKDCGQHQYPIPYPLS